MTEVHSFLEGSSFFTPGDIADYFKDGWDWIKDKFKEPEKSSLGELNIEESGSEESKKGSET